MKTKTVYVSAHFTLLYYGQSLRVYIKKLYRGEGFKKNPYWTFGQPEDSSAVGRLIGVVERTLNELLSKDKVVSRDAFQEKALSLCSLLGLKHKLEGQVSNKPLTVSDWYNVIYETKKVQLKASSLKSKVEGLLHKKMQLFFPSELTLGSVEALINSIDYNQADRLNLLGFLKEGLLLLPPNDVSEKGIDMIDRACLLTRKAARKVKTSDWEKFSYSDSEVEIILGHLEEKLHKNGSDRLALFFYVGFKTGMRIGELIGLQFWQVSLLRKEILICQQWNKVTGQISSTKTGTERTLLFGDELYRILFSSLASRMYSSRNSFVFGTEKEPCKVSQLYVYWSKVISDLRETKDPDFPLYKMSSFRHSFVTNQLKKGVDPLAVAKAVGHSPKTALTYYRDFSTTDDTRFD